MSKDNKLDPNVAEFFQEMEEKNKQEAQTLKEGEYIICTHCSEKTPKNQKICVFCGKRAKPTSTYTPLSEKKAMIIRWTIGAIMLIGFFVAWFVMG